VQARLAEFRIKTTIVAKNIGYELRCVDPIPADMEYSRDLGYFAAKYILEGGNGAMVSVQSGEFIPIPFDAVVDAVTGRPKIRMVNINTGNYESARMYMIRLTPEDFDNPHELANYAATAGIGLDEFEKQFKYLVEHDSKQRSAPRRTGAPDQTPRPKKKNP
jgi:hypothetical protein